MRWARWWATSPGTTGTPQWTWGSCANALRACAAEGAPPHEVLQRLDRLCLQQGLGGMATVLYAVLDPVLGTPQLANAGHYPPLLVTADGGPFLQSAACPPIVAAARCTTRRRCTACPRQPARALHRPPGRAA